MKKLLSLIKACLKDNMSIFKIKGSSKGKKYLPFILSFFLMFSFYANTQLLMEPLKEYHLEYVVIVLFVLGTSFMTFIEGIYKSSGLLFNCKDDSLLLSLPISKSTVFFVRTFKFYIFELIFNSLFLFPALLCYGINVDVGISYWFVLVLGLLLLPIIPIVLSTIASLIISYNSSKFKNKNIAQTIIAFIFVFITFVVSFAIEKVANVFFDHAESFGNIIMKYYYPSRLFTNLIINFNFIDLLLFFLVNVIPLIIMVLALKNVYFRINSSLKIVKKKGSHNSNEKYEINVLSKRRSFIKKEIKKLINTPVYIINSCFGLFLYLGVVIILVVKIDFIYELLKSKPELSSLNIESSIALVMFGLIVFTLLMSSLTCSMVSLEGKAFNVLKSLPLKPIEILMYKVDTVLAIEVPVVFSGLLLAFIRFKIGIIEILLLAISGVILAYISALFGLIINIKFPKLDAKDDTEVVKQSMSSFIAVTGGIIGSSVMIGLLIMFATKIHSVPVILFLMTLINLVIALLLYFYAKKVSSKEFELLVV